MNRSSLLLLSVLLLGGCQSNAPQAPAPVTPAPAPEKAEKPPLKPAPFQADTLYDLLLGEIAGQRDHVDIALENYLRQARQTRDPGVAERAFRIAEYLNDNKAALESAQIWVKATPDDLEAQRMVAISLARAGRHDEAMVHMEKVLTDNGETSFDFLALSASQLDPAARAGLRESFERLLKRYPDNMQLVIGRALLLLHDHELGSALESLENHPLRDTKVAAILLRLQLLEQLGRSDEILPLLQHGVQLHPDDNRLRLAYARQLVEKRDMTGAIVQFQELLQRIPNDDDIRLSLALVSIEAGKLDEARHHLQTLILRDAHTDSALFNLGRIAELQGQPANAEQQYRQVQPGNSYMSAIARLNALLISNGRAPAALELLQEERDNQPEYALQLYLLELESLSELGRNDEAWQRSSEALEHFPGDLSLYYARAMLAEKRGDLGSTESNLRLILEREPDNSMALNALGYTLADRTTRYTEALALIEKAYALDSSDPAILDSLGWVHYRLGRLEQAEDLLRQALQQLPDAEIAAHLGEVLWINGKRDEAREIWRIYWQETPDNPILLETLRRLTGKEMP